MNSKYDATVKEDEIIIYKTYPGEHMINDIINLMQVELSEPYPIFTYRYFLNRWPECCIVCFDKTSDNKFIGCIIGNCEVKKRKKMKGYIAMLAVEKKYRGRRIGKTLVELFISQCKNVYEVHEIFLETEVTNTAALNLYDSLGFVRTKKLINYYLNGNSAFRLKVWIRENMQAVENEISN